LQQSRWPQTADLLAREGPTAGADLENVSQRIAHSSARRQDTTKDRLESPHCIGMRKINEQQVAASAMQKKVRLAERASVELLHALQARPTGAQKERRWQQ
jgi:hypothetical protein